MDYMSTDFGADSSSHFPFRKQANRQMRLNAVPHAGGYTAGVGNKTSFIIQVLGDHDSRV